MSRNYFFEKIEKLDAKIVKNPQNQKHERLPNHFTEDRAVQGAMQEFPMHLEALYIAEMGFGRLAHGFWACHSKMQPGERQLKKDADLCKTHFLFF